jgi:hypothetical protein
LRLDPQRCYGASVFHLADVKGVPHDPLANAAAGDVAAGRTRTVYDLMDLYPQGAKGRQSVLYVPVRRGFGGSDLFPSLPGLMP